MEGEKEWLVIVAVGKMHLIVMTVGVDVVTPASSIHLYSRSLHLATPTCSHASHGTKETQSSSTLDHSVPSRSRRDDMNEYADVR